VPELIANIDVDDLPRGEAFYTAALGLRRGRRFGADAVELVGASARLFLLARAAGTAPCDGAAGRRYARHWTPVHLDFAVTDLAAALASARAAGAVLERDVASYAFGRMAMLADPFGHGFCLIEFGPGGYDAGLAPEA
jgi:predicted enzyme related to lactoylglutathione lyase